MWQRFCRLMAGLLRSLSVLSWLDPEAEIPPIASQGPGGPATGPPLGHPERLADSRPLTPAERELWASLEEFDR